MSRYVFSGHESFICKSLWLKKGYDFLKSGSNFNDSDAVVKLGVGKNMVSALRFWMKSFGLTENDHLTDFADFIFGVDTYIEDTGTLWLLHYKLVHKRIASIYNLAFLEYQREKKEFDRESFLSFIKRKCNTPEQKNVFNENTVRRDISVFLRNYVKPENLNSPEDFSALLLDLKLVYQSNKTCYTFNETRVTDISPFVILFALLDIKGNDSTLSSDVLQTVALIFCMPFNSFTDILFQLSEMFPDLIAYSDNSGVKNVQFLREADKYQLMRNSYK